MDDGGTPLIKRCDACGQSIKDGDPITFIGEAVYREVPSKVSFAINEISACYSLQHKWCGLDKREEYA